MKREELIRKLKAITSTHPSMGDVSDSPKKARTCGGCVKYHPPGKRAEIYESRARDGASLAHHIAGILDQGKNYDFNSAEAHNSGLLGALGVDFSCQIIIED